jgi:polyhydroxybutyrate depolymerase
MSYKKLNFIIFTMLLTIILVVTSFSGCIYRQESIVYNGRNRYYDIYVPKSYNHLTSVPLLIVLHYGGANGEIIEEVTEISQKADEEGFIVIYPYGTGRFDDRLLTWNAGYCAGYALENNIDDVGFIRALIEKIQKTLKIDTSRIYITGFCNGAAMTYRLGAELSDIVAAIAPVAGSIGGKTTAESPLWVVPEPEQAIPVIIFHGTKDTYVPYNGGITTGGGTYSILSVNDSISFWVEQNGCPQIPDINVSESGNIIIKSYDNCPNNADVVLYTIVNGGHAWPGGNKFVGGDEPTQEISATDIIWEFFEDHPKNNPSLRTEFVDPLDTDQMITPLNELPDSENRNLNHFVAVASGIEKPGYLYVHLPGSGGLPEDYQIVTKHIASLGYHVINLAYPNWPAVRILIQDKTDPELPEYIRIERLYGEDKTDLIEVSYTDSVENRIIKLLEYNCLRYPDEGWGIFLTEENNLCWDRIVVGGHSQGAGHAAYITKNHELRGIVMFAGPGDFVKDFGSAPWLLKDSLVDSEKMFGFTHRLDPVSKLFFNHQELLGLGDFGAPQRVDNLEINELKSHILTSFLLNINSRNYHGAVAVDEHIPFKNDGITPQYEVAWTYMFNSLLE